MTSSLVNAAHPVFPRADVILKAFRGSDHLTPEWLDQELGLGDSELDNRVIAHHRTWLIMVELAASMVPAHEKRRYARTYLTDPMLTDEWRVTALSMVQDADADLAGYVESLDLLVTITLDVHRTRGLEVPTVAALMKRPPVPRHTETVGLVVCRLAQLWLDDLHSDEAAGSQMEQLARAYDDLIAELVAGTRLPLGM